MKYTVKFINKIIYLMIALWTFVSLISFSIATKHNFDYAKSLAKNEAVVSVKKDLAYRFWISSHGGIYVPITKRTPVNPYLLHLKNRDVHTSDGQHLTLMNPTYTLSQIMQDYTKLYGTQGHITSRILMNPKNKPDKWEEKALKIIEVTHKSLSKFTMLNGEEYFRYIKPLAIQQSCLKCHAFQGYKVGDISGGVSISVPMKKYYENVYANSYWIYIIILVVYLFGLAIIVYGRKKALEMIDDKIKDYEQHIYTLVKMIEKRDSYTAGHSKRVADYSILIAREMGCEEDKIEELYRASMLHDIGKVSTPDSILLKPGKLTELEYDIIKEHVVVSYELLNKVDIYKDIAEIVRHHHEHYDGSGYPQGFKHDEIPILSQIMTVADSFDAMTTNRIYKSRKTVETALGELKSLASKQFHPLVVKAALRVLKDADVDINITQKPKNKMEKARFAYFYKDQLTDVYNKEYLEFVMAYNHTDEFNIKCLYLINLHNFSQYNKQNGWREGDLLLRKFAEALTQINKSNLIFRVYGDDFVILNKNHLDTFEQSLEHLNKVLKDTGVSFTYKHFDLRVEKIHSIDELENIL